MLLHLIAGKAVANVKILVSAYGRRTYKEEAWILFIRRLARGLVETAYTLAVTFFVGKWAVHTAYLERGYRAIGGEYLLILVTYWAAWKTIHYLFDALEEMDYERRCKKRRSGRTAEKRDHR